MQRSLDVATAPIELISTKRETPRLHRLLGKARGAIYIDAPEGRVRLRVGVEYVGAGRQVKNGVGTPGVPGASLFARRYPPRRPRVGPCPRLPLADGWRSPGSATRVSASAPRDSRTGIACRPDEPRRAGDQHSHVKLTPSPR